MNRIYQGEVTKVEILFPSSEGRVEIANPHILSASTGERTEVRCRNQDPWLALAYNPEQAKAKWQSARHVLSASNGERSEVSNSVQSTLNSQLSHEHHQIFQDAVNSEIMEHL